jgi:hypothetical protein
MAFVRFSTLFSDHYYPEHQIKEMRVVSSDDPTAGPHMTIVHFVDGFEIEQETYYVEPVFV